MGEILVTKPGALTAADRKLLRDSGVVVVEAKNPAEVKLISTERGELDGGALLHAAVKAVAGGDWKVHEAFAKAVLAALPQTKEPSQ